MILSLGRIIFDTAWGKAALAAAGVIAMFGAWLVRHDAHVESRARQEFTTKVEKATEKARDKAVKARKPADLPGAADRLRKSSCRDC